MDFIASKKRQVNTSLSAPLKARPIAGSPVAHALSEQIQILDDSRFDSARHGVSLIEDVHGARNLDIETGFDRLNANTDAAYAPANLQNQKKGIIFYNPQKNVSTIAFLEEMGHALDHQAFSALDGFASDVGNSSIEPVLDAIRSSATYGRIKSYQVGQTIRLRQDSKFETLTITNLRTLHYEQSIVEWFARAYVQFIAVSTDNTALLRELATLRTSETFELLYPYAWPDDEFEQIANSLETVLHDQGWIR